MPVKKSSTTNKAKKPSAAAQAMAAQAAQSAIIRAAVPQWFRLDPDQVPNNAGGFVWQISDKEQVIRYLIIGSEGGNFYQTPQQVSSQCASCVLRMTRTPDNFKWLIDTIRQVSTSGRAAKQESTLLALATAIVFARTPADKTEALNAVKDCVRILTHMYMLIGYIKIFSKAGHPSLTASPAASASTSNVVPVAGGRNPPVTVGSGIGRGIRRVFGEYFYSRTGIEIANLMTKYQNREGWTIKDVLTLIHIDSKKMKDDGGRLAIEHVFKTKEEFAPILAAAPPTAEATKTLLSAIKEIHTIAERPLQPATNPSLAGLSNYQYAEELDRIVHLINTVGLCREQLPSQLFKYRKVWEALLMSKGANGKGKGMPLTALIRNLGKLSTTEIGIITPSAPLTKHICDRITDAHDIKRSKIHPYNILVAMLTYKKGAGDKGSLVWAPNPNIIAALDKAFKLAFQNITPTGKRIKIALDVSGSMSSAYCTGSPVVSCAIGSVAMMMMTLYVENQHRLKLAASSVPDLPSPAAAAQQLAEAMKWKTTQLPDGRTLYEHTETKQCQFTKPASLAGGGAAARAATQAKLAPLGGATPSSAAPSRPPTLTEYKATKKYLGHPDAQPAATETRPSFGYSSYYSSPPTPYLPELYPSPQSVAGGRNPPSNVTICAFSNTLTELTNAIVGYMDATIDPATGLPTMTIDDALKLVEMPFSSTDCALPMVRALENREQVDAFVIYTDSETYMGKIHPQAALEEYRRTMGIDAKLIVVGMTSNCLTIADPKDLNTLNLAGFDTATPRLINDFISGGLLPPPTAPAPAAAAASPAAKAQGGAQPGAQEDTDEFVMLEAED
jgi:60 kDa SS-A/Ro ribonucleoprotein